MQPDPAKSVPYEFDDWKIISKLGEGATCNVYLVENKKSKELLAMKSMKKGFIIERSLESKVLLEKMIMQQDDHPFIMNVSFVYVQPYRIYFLMPYFR